MGRKHVLSIDMLQAGSGASGSSMATTITSRVIDTSQLDNASLHLKWVAGPAGTLQVFVRNNEKDAYYALDFGSPISLSTVDSDVQIVFTKLPFINLYFVYTPTSGSGTLGAYMSLRTVGA